MVEYLKFKDKKLPVRISYYALSQYKKETGSDFDEKSVSGGFDLEMFEPIMFFSIESGSRALGEKMPIKRKDMFEVLEECFMDFANLMPKFFPDKSDLEKKDQAPAVGNRQQRREAKKTD